METLEVALGARSYPIYIGPGLVSDAGLIARAVDARQILVVSNTTVAPLYLDRVLGALGASSVRVVVLPDGEQHKNLDSFATIIDALIDGSFHRDACLVALGGGVVGDIAGFAAASYQRGIRYVQIPTTLLAQVDSSVGGKTAVNHPRAKNMIGAFYQPAAVVADTATLRTLPPREFAAGMAEVIKYGLILDAEFFDWLENNIDAALAQEPAALQHIVRRCCELKAEIVAEDEQERGRRALLNLGHTFGHALESIGKFERWLHGEAVAIGMVMAAQTSLALGKLDAADVGRVRSLLERAALPTRAHGVDVERMLELMRIDKKASATGLRLILLECIGDGIVTPAPDADLLRAVLTAELGD